MSAASWMGGFEVMFWLQVLDEERLLRVQLRPLCKAPEVCPVEGENKAAIDGGAASTLSILRQDLNSSS